jgi:hypothetical protein
MFGGSVSTMVTVWLQKEELVEVSVALQVRVTLNKTGHLGLATLVTVLTTSISTLAPSISSFAVGMSNAQALPHCAALSLPQVMVGGVVSAALAGRAPRTTEKAKAAIARHLGRRTDWPEGSVEVC